MRPTISEPLLRGLQALPDAPPWKCKLRMRGGRYIYNVEVNADGEIVSVGGRAIYSLSDVGFRPGAIEAIEVQGWPRGAK